MSRIQATRARASDVARPGRKPNAAIPEAVRGPIVFVILLVAPLVTTIYLARRLRRDARAGAY